METSGKPRGVEVCRGIQLGRLQMPRRLAARLVNSGLGGAKEALEP